MVLAARRRPDPTIYREEDDVGEHELQTYILEILRPLLARFLATRGEHAHVGSDQFIYWVEHDPTQSVAPDLYVLPGVDQAIAIRTWKTFETGIVPSFALEVVGTDPEKDYDEGPRRYAALGVRELIVFDPFPGTRRVRWQIYRRSARGFRSTGVAAGDRVRSRELRCFLRVVGKGMDQRLRIGTGIRGDDLFSTAEEAALARVAELEALLRKRSR
jgi:hypothetical protein